MANDRIDIKQIQDFIKQMEGYSPKEYMDYKGGNPSTSYGINKNSPSYEKALNTLNLQDSKEFTPEQNEALFQEHFKDAAKYLKNVRKTDFPHFKSDQGKETALHDIMYNAPNLLDEQMRKNLEENNTRDAIKQMIMINDLTGKNPGLMKRGFKRAEQFSPEEFKKFQSELSDIQLRDLKDQWNKIQNINERQQVLRDYPFLDKLVMPRFGKIPKE